MHCIDLCFIINNERKMKTFKLVLLIVVLAATSWLMAEGVRINVLANASPDSETVMTPPSPVHSAKALR